MTLVSTNCACTANSCMFFGCFVTLSPALFICYFYGLYALAIERLNTTLRGVRAWRASLLISVTFFSLKIARCADKRNNSL